MALNRRDRRAARAVNDYAIRKLGAAVQHRDRARDALAADEKWIEGQRLAGRATVALEARLTAVRSALDAAERELDEARAAVAVREEALEAAQLDIIIHGHLTEIGLDAIPY